MRKYVNFLIRLVPFSIEVIYDDRSHQASKMLVTLLREGASEKRYILRLIIAKIVLRLTCQITKQL